MSIVINGNGSIQGISAGGLPDGSVTADDIASLPAGSVIQVVQGSATSQVVVTTASYTDTGLSASITPTSTSSKILVLVSQNIYISRNSDGRNTARFRLLRDATSVFEDQLASSFIGGLNGLSEMRKGNRNSIIYLDTPSTTSAITYKTQGYPEYIANSGAAYFQITSASPATITLMEIAA